MEMKSTSFRTFLLSNYCLKTRVHIGRGFFLLPNGVNKQVAHSDYSSERSKSDLNAASSSTERGTTSTTQA